MPEYFVVGQTEEKCRRVFEIGDGNGYGRVDGHVGQNNWAKYIGHESDHVAQDDRDRPRRVDNDEEDVHGKDGYGEMVVSFGTSFDFGFWFHQGLNDDNVQDEHYEEGNQVPR